jgi:hypothetical protein
MPLGVLMTDILPSLMAFDLQRLLLMMVCKGNFRLAEAKAPRLTPMGGCGVLTVDLTVILSLPIGQGIGRPAPVAKKKKLVFACISIYTTIGIGRCTLGVVIVSITTKPYILLKFLFQ